jgi:DNA-binding HxlR family transcriptional regulator
LWGIFIQNTYFVGSISRKVFPGKVLQVEYSLTEKGASLLPVFETLYS